jgi:hypothetical protein
MQQGGIMRVTLIALVVVAALSGSADAGPFRRRASAVISNVSHATAAGAARAMAAIGRVGHFRNPTATAEGVGFSTSSPQDALDRCCFSRSGRVVVDSAVARGPGGWYAVKRYR